MSYPSRALSASLRTALVALLSLATIAAGTSVPELAVAAAGTPGGFTALAPTRLLDTRTGLGLPGSSPAAVAHGAEVSLQVEGRGGVPSVGVDSVVLNVTVTSPSSAGYVTVYAGGTTRPAVTSVSFAAAQTVANLVVARVGSDGKVSLANISAGTIHLVADVSGYFLAGTGRVAGTYASLAPARVMDTQVGVGAPRAAVGAYASVSLLVAGAGRVPASGAAAVALTVTATAATTAGYLTVYGSGSPRPAASGLNFRPGRATSNLLVVPVGPDGRVVLYNGSPGSVGLSADVSGYYLGGRGSAAGTFGSLAPARLLDTRTGLGLGPAPGPRVATVIAAARSILGIPYSYGGGTPAGPTLGTGSGAHTVGFDCSSAVQYEYAKAGVVLARVTTGQEKQGTAVALVGASGLGGAIPGDLLFWGRPGATSHVALYIGSGQMIEAQQTGTRIQVDAVWGNPSVIRRIFPTVASSVAVPAGATVRLVVAGRGGVPASGISAALLNVTAVSPTRAGYLTVYASGTSRPTASNLNFGLRQTIPNLVVTPVGADRSILLYNGSSGTVHLVVDVSGFFRT